MFKFIQYFIMQWKYYPQYMFFVEKLKENSPEEYEKMCESDRVRGVDPEYKSRFDFAWRNAKIHYAHRDRYGRKCRKYGGDCERCNAKHC